MSVVEVNDELQDWASIEGRHHGHGLLIGNGASLAVWDRFSYKSLYDQAPLTSADKAVFIAADTQNFELVLDALRISEIVCGAVGHDPNDARARYESVRNALFEAVRLVHVPWAVLPWQPLWDIEREFSRYDKIFSTNYDLLAYWSIMSRYGASIRDYFWNPDHMFDSSNTGVRDNVSTILYLHGGIHLYMDAITGATVKRTPLGGGLLDFSDIAAGNRTPLFVSEGTSSDKMRSIRRSDYLSFCYQTLADYTDPLVIFGHSLGQSDVHIAQAIRSQDNREIAFGLLPGLSPDIIENKTRVNRTLTGQRITYFNAETHPLGDDSLKVTA